MSKLYKIIYFQKIEKLKNKNNGKFHIYLIRKNYSVMQQDIFKNYIGHRVRDICRILPH